MRKVLSHPHLLFVYRLDPFLYTFTSCLLVIFVSVNTINGWYMLFVRNSFSLFCLILCTRGWWSMKRSGYFKSLELWRVPSHRRTDHHTLFGEHWAAQWFALVTFFYETASQRFIAFDFCPHPPLKKSRRSWTWLQIGSIGWMRIKMTLNVKVGGRCLQDLLWNSYSNAMT